MDYAGSTQQYQSPYNQTISAVDLGGTMDMPLWAMLSIAALGIVLLPLGTLITGIVICVKRKRK
jgi:hypothetical protein